MPRRRPGRRRSATRCRRRRMARDRAWLLRVLPDIRDDEFIFLCVFDVGIGPVPQKSRRRRSRPSSRAFKPDEPVRLIDQVD